MTTTELLELARVEPDEGDDAWRARRPWRRRRAADDGPALEQIESADLPPLTPRLQLVRAGCVMVLALSLTFFLHLLVLSPFQQRASQERAISSLRGDLAFGTAPIGPYDSNGDLLSVGAPVARLEIPRLGLDQVVVEGTTAGALFLGPGHRRDTPLPGQNGVSVVFGRRAAYGAPFKGISSLEAGDIIRVTTGQGTFLYNVLGVRKEGDPVQPPPAPNSSRLVLATADGRIFMPDGVVRVDADLNGDAVVGAPRVISASGLPSDEQLMAGDTGTLWALGFWLLALTGVALATVWSRFRWGRAQTWVVFAAPLLFVGLATSGEVVRLLPNLL